MAILSLRMYVHGFSSNNRNLRTNPDQTTVSCHHYASYHSESNFAFPDKFMPERWLGSDPVFERDNKDVLQPFSLGPRGCLGKQCVLSRFPTSLILTCSPLLV
jgi:cytochrome P450